MSLYKQPGSEIWWSRFTLNGEKLRFSTGEYDRAAAQKVEDRRRADQHDAPKLKGKTWGQAVIKWAEAQTRSESDLQSLAKFGSFYKDRLLISVSPGSIDEALKKFIKSEGTYNRYLTRISAVLALSGVKFKLAKKRNKDAKVRTWLTHEQWEKLAKELPKHQRLMATFAINTGLRQANVLGLLWSQVDLERRLVWVEGNEMKGGKAIGVPLNKEAMNVLKLVSGQDKFWVFTYRGKPIAEIKTAFQAACIRAGVGRVEEAHDPALLPHTRGHRKGAGVYTGFTWHGLRHTWATWHAQNGTPLEVLQELGGWTDMRMLTQNYAHHVAGLKASYAENVRKR